jgi:hypothetical protein
VKWPSAKTLFLAAALFLCVALISAALFADEKQSPETLSVSTEGGDLDSLSWQVATMDLDNDGLRDWEETLLGTDPGKEDTDEDGTNDGKEIQEGRDPLVQGPDDKKETPNTAETILTEEGTTGEVGKQLFAGYLSLKQQGLLDDTGSRNELLNKLITTTQLRATPTRHTLSDLDIVAETKESVRAYANQYGLALQKILEVKENELVTFTKAVDTKNPEELKKLDSAIAIYESAIDILLMAPVPQSASTEHLALINSFVDLIAMLEKMERLYQDPLGALASLNTMDKVQQSLQGALVNVNRYLNGRKNLL